MATAPSRVRPLERPEVSRRLAVTQEERFRRVLMLDYDCRARLDLVDATI